MRIVYIGCVDFSYSILDYLLGLSIPEAEVVGVVTRQQSKFNADHRSLQPLAMQYGISCFGATGNDQELMAAYLEELCPEVIFCFGWSYLLKENILKIPSLGLIGFHPADLPRNRGRHPLIWALVLGLQETASTFFFMDEGADSGDILDQKVISIEEADDAGSLYKKVTNTAKQQVAAFVPKLIDGTYTRVPQDHSKANYWRKRGKNDGAIDWRISSRGIHNIVRGLTRPYVGAHCYFKGKEIRIWKTKLVQAGNGELTNIEPGKVLKSGDDGILVKCGEGVIELLEHEFDEMPGRGSYL